jgi:hypothetical protein
LEDGQMGYDYSNMDQAVIAPRWRDVAFGERLEQFFFSFSF